MGPSKRKTGVADSHLLLKGYLPVRLILTSSSGADDVEYETFFYVKEHQHKKAVASNGDHTDDATQSTKQPTLFVANAPSYPPIETPTMLKSLFGRYGNIKRVTVVPNPRGHTNNVDAGTASPDGPSYFPSIVTDRFAHVVFESSKDLQKCYKALVRVMSSEDQPALTLDPVERQTLSDAIHSRQKEGGEAINNDNNYSDDQDRSELSGIQKVLKNYRQSRRRYLQRQTLMEECNAVMQAYEEAEQARLRAVSSEPDEDGFITITHSTQPSDEALEQDARPHRQAAKGRSRKRKKGPGATELDDFYRFQAKAKRKEDIQDLRTRFQEDLTRIKKIKETKGGFKPFG